MEKIDVNRYFLWPSVILSILMVSFALIYSVSRGSDPATYGLPKAAQQQVQQPAPTNTQNVGSCQTNI